MKALAWIYVKAMFITAILIVLCIYSFKFFKNKISSVYTQEVSLIFCGSREPILVRFNSHTLITSDDIDINKPTTVLIIPALDEDKNIINIRYLDVCDIEWFRVWKNEILVFDSEVSTSRNILVSK